MATRTAILIVALMLAGGCASDPYNKLPCEKDMPHHCEMARKCAALPNHQGYVTVGEVNGEPVRVWCRHTRGGTSGRLILLLHGILTDSSAMRYLAGDLGDKHDLLLVDHLGCGQSDKPDPADMPPDGYSPAALARHVLLVLREHAGDDRITVVGHSLGSLVVLRMLGDPGLRREFHDEIAKIDRAVLLSPIDFAIGARQPTFEALLGTSSLELQIGDLLGIVRARLAESYCDGAGDVACMPREAVDEARRVLTNPETLRVGKAMIRQAIPLRGEHCFDRDRIHEIVKHYRNIDVPCLLISGEGDCTFSCAMGYKIRAQLPQAWLRVIPCCGHSMNLEQPCEVADTIDRFVEHGGADLPPVMDEIVAPYRL